MKSPRKPADRTVQVRLDPELKDRLDDYLGQLRARDPRATESLAVRSLLRAALASTSGQPLVLDDAGFREGLRRGYDEVRRAITTALAPLLGRPRSP